MPQKTQPQADTSLHLCAFQHRAQQLPTSSLALWNFLELLFPCSFSALQLIESGTAEPVHLDEQIVLSFSKTEAQQVKAAPGPGSRTGSGSLQCILRGSRLPLGDVRPLTGT